MLSGLIFWGGAGYLADKYIFNTGYLTLVGFLLGMGGALYLIWLRFGRE
jgi:ATP synthase protein I